MPCDTQLLPNQTIKTRIEEIKEAVAKIAKGLASGKVRAVVGPQGAIAFDGVTEADRARVTDACAYRRIMISGSPLAKAAIQRAEQLAGRTVDKKAIAHGHHSHDGGKTWHHGH